MISNIQSSPVSVPTMNAWAFQPTGSVGTSVTGIIYAHVTINMGVDSSALEHKNSIQQLIAEREKDPRKSAALARARQRIAAFINIDGETSLAKIRLSKGFSQSQLAEAMGVKQPYIARIERGVDDLKFSTLESLAKALNEPVSSIAQALASSRSSKEVAA